MLTALFKWGSWACYWPSLWRQTRKTPLGDTNCDGAGMLQKTQHCQEFFHVLGLAPDLSHPEAQQGPCWIDDMSPLCWFLTIQIWWCFSLCDVGHGCLLLFTIATACLHKAVPFKGSKYRCKTVISFGVDKSQFLLLFLLQCCPFVHNGTKKRISAYIILSYNVLAHLYFTMYESCYVWALLGSHLD